MQNTKREHILRVSKTLQPIGKLVKTGCKKDSTASGSPWSPLGVSLLKSINTIKAAEKTQTSLEEAESS